MHCIEHALKNSSFSRIILGDDMFFLTHYQGQDWLVPAKCPHRGGPLYSGDDLGDKIKCPWHGRVVSKKGLIGKSLPFLISGTRMTIVSKKEIKYVGTIGVLNKNYTLRAG